MDIENHIKSCSTCLDFQQTQPKENFMHHDIPGKLWKVLGADMFTLNKKLPLYCRLSQQISNCKEAEYLSKDNLILACKIILQNIASCNSANICT